jgi:xanthosine utilization system XapX-like protein
MNLSTDNILKKGNGSLFIGLIFSISSVQCPCPTCIGAAALGILNGAREKFGMKLPSRLSGP